MADKSSIQLRNDVCAADDELNRLGLCSYRLVLNEHLYLSLDLVAVLNRSISLIPRGAHVAQLLNKLVYIGVIDGAYRLLDIYRLEVSKIDLRHYLKRSLEDSLFVVGWPLGNLDGGSSGRVNIVVGEELSQAVVNNIVESCVISFGTEILSSN